MPIVLDGIAGITTPEIVSTGGPLVVNASAPDNSVVVNASGNVGIGTSSPAATLTVAHASGVDGRGIRLVNSSNSQTWETRIGVEGIENTSYAIKDITAGAARLLIDTSGNLLVGTTTSPVAGKIASSFLSSSSQFGAVFIDSQSNNTAIFAQFRNASTAIGSITNNNNTATAYNTSSDYRLKHDIVPMTGALAQVALLKPCTYKWNVNESAGEGFIAHELAEVVPGCVTGEKDAVDAEGNPQYQGIDTSFLVATLTAAIQEQQAIIESLTARVVALENQIV